MIVVDKVSKSFKGAEKSVTKAVNQVSLTAKPGRIHAVLGPNGSGKTTLLRMLVGLLKSDEGSIHIEGSAIPSELQRVKAKLGFLTGSAALHKKLTVKETLHLFADFHGMSTSLRKQRTEQMVEQMGMNGFYGKLVASLSMGQKQRVMVARTLLHDPSVIIFDEATVGLDVMASKILVETVKLCRQKSKTVIFSTHIMGEVSRLADDVTVLHQGRVLFNGEFEMFRSRCGENIEEGFVNLLESGGRA